MGGADQKAFNPSRHYNAVWGTASPRRQWPGVAQVRRQHCQLTLLPLQVVHGLLQRPLGRVPPDLRLLVLGGGVLQGPRHGAGYAKNNNTAAADWSLIPGDTPAFSATMVRSSA